MRGLILPHEQSACVDALHKAWSGHWSCLNCSVREVGAIGTSSFYFVPHSFVSEVFRFIWNICMLTAVMWRVESRYNAFHD